MKQWYWKKSTQSFLKPQDLVFIDSSKLIFCYISLLPKKLNFQNRVCPITLIDLKVYIFRIEELVPLKQQVLVNISWFLKLIIEYL